MSGNEKKEIRSTVGQKKIRKNKRVSQPREAASINDQCLGKKRKLKWDGQA